MSEKIIHGRMPGGYLFTANTSYRKFKRVWQRALRRNQLIVLTNSKGKRWAINPRQISYIGEGEATLARKPA